MVAYKAPIVKGQPLFTPEAASQLLRACSKTPATLVTGYDSGSAVRLASVQIFFGVLLTALFIAGMVLNLQYLSMFITLYDLWCSLLYLSAGVTGLVAARQKTARAIRAALVGSILAFNFSIFQFVCNSWALAQNEESLHNSFSAVLLVSVIAEGVVAMLMCLHCMSRPRGYPDIEMTRKY